MKCSKTILKSVWNNFIPGLWVPASSVVSGPFYTCFSIFAKNLILLMIFLPLPLLWSVFIIGGSRKIRTIKGKARQKLILIILQYVRKSLNKSIVFRRWEQM